MLATKRVTSIFCTPEGQKSVFSLLSASKVSLQGFLQQQKGEKKWPRGGKEKGRGKKRKYHFPPTSPKRQKERCKIFLLFARPFRRRAHRKENERIRRGKPIAFAKRIYLLLEIFFSGFLKRVLKFLKKVLREKVFSRPASSLS